MIIIGITGTIGAGKGTVVEYLVKHHGYSHFSVRKFLTEAIHQLNLPLNRDSMVEVANEMRANNSPSYIVEQLLQKAIENGEHAIIESIRTPGEIDALRQKANFFLLAVDADPALRYDRVIKRKSETDQISFEVFIENEKREMTSTDPNKQNLANCIAKADFVLNNDGSFEDLDTQIETILHQMENTK
jgi:dephospho-CoA kinase